MDIYNEIQAKKRALKRHQIKEEYDRDLKEYLERDE